MPVAQRTARRLLFPEKLWDLVNKQDSGINWSEDGTCIEVERTQWEKSVGSKFRSKNFDSFIRQLHFYGFKKTGNSYYHENFQQNQFELVLTMKRKYSNGTGPCDSPRPETTITATSRTNNVLQYADSNNNDNVGADTIVSVAPVIVAHKKVARRKPAQPQKNAPVATVSLAYMIQQQQQVNPDCALDLSKKSTTRIQNQSSIPSSHSNNNNNNNNNGIDYSNKTKKQRILAAVARSPSKSMSRSQQPIVVQVGQSN